MKELKPETFKRINELTDAQQARLEEIIREHLRLAKEHMQPGTSCKRKKEIFSRIAMLRAERLELVGE